MEDEYLVTQRLPDNGKKVLAFGFRTFCCKLDMDDEAKWHEVIFSFEVSRYKLKKEMPEDIEDSILEEYTMLEHWTFDKEEPSHLVGVTKWKYLDNGR